LVFLAVSLTRVGLAGPGRQAESRPARHPGKLPSGESFEQHYVTCRGRDKSSGQTRPTFDIWPLMQVNTSAFEFRPYPDSQTGQSTRLPQTAKKASRWNLFRSG
jgi:hypothetical protein